MILCVTGKMAAGKNAASEILERRGFACVDADRVVHEILLEKQVQERIVEEFGKVSEEMGIKIVSDDGSLDRRALGRVVFSDGGLLERQERIVLPEVEARLRRFIEENCGKNVVLNATVLYKIPCVRVCDAVLFVDAPVFLRLFRARRRDGIGFLQIARRFWSQRNLFSKYKKSNADTFKVRNSSTLDALEKKLMKKIDEAFYGRQ